jgi:glutamine cyclotransferase
VIRSFLLLGASFLLISANAVACASSPQVEQLRVEVIERRPHDPTAFTQGLALDEGRLYESTGLYGESTLREVDPLTGDVLRSIDLDPSHFGEGIAVVDDRVIQLTWQEHTALEFALADFAQTGAFWYDTEEGWGLCDDGSRVVMSDGTDQLHFRDRTTFALQGAVPVTNAGATVEGLNELECVDGQVYANVLSSDTILRIDPTNGAVTAEIDASGLLTMEESAEVSVLNGIAYDATDSTFLLTGKLWPTMFKVRFVTEP